MRPETFREAVSGLFSICVATAAMDLLAGEGGASQSLRGLCGLAAAVCALRAVLGSIKL